MKITFYYQIVRVYTELVCGAFLGPACPEGEVYKDCRDPCVDESCDAMGSLIPGCKSPEPCEPGCVCREGFYKLYNFICVPKCYCPGFWDSPECRN